MIDKKSLSKTESKSQKIEMKNLLCRKSKCVKNQPKCTEKRKMEKLKKSRVTMREEFDRER